MLLQDEKATPIKQDVKKGNLRFYPYNINWNYGLLPQTWEDPSFVNKEVDAAVSAVSMRLHCCGEQEALPVQLQDASIAGIVEACCTVAPRLSTVPCQHKWTKH